MDKFEKQPYEKFYIATDFTDVLLEDETISSAAITATDNLIIAADEVIDGNPIIDGVQVKIRVQAGDETKTPYKITFRIITDTGNQWEHDVIMRVKEQ